MKLIQKYFLRQTLTPLLLALGSLSLLALLTQSLSTIDLIIENRQSALTFLYITVLTLPQLFSIIMPLAVFMAMIYALNRLNVDSELVVTKASGFSPWQIASPALRLASYALIVHLIINLFVQPFSFRQMRKALLDVRADVASRMVRPGEFNNPAPGLTLYASEILPSGRMKDVLIYDERSIETPMTYMAHEGLISSVNGRTSFTLFQGSIHYVNKNGTMDITDFEQTTQDLTDIMAVDIVLRLKTSDRYLYELFYPDPDDYVEPKRRDEFRAEAHSRLSTPLYNVALVLLALAFLIRGEHQKLGYTRRIAVVAALGFIARLIGFGLASGAESNPALNIAQYCLPLGISVVAIWYLLHPRRAQTIFHIPFLKSKKMGLSSKKVAT
ncbi:MAG: LptF/LptG family permease [Rhodobacteraceae bacterium]|nr:LptF/LptG family permease [Paracoccaceae bacterium]